MRNDNWYYLIVLKWNYVVDFVYMIYERFSYVVVDGSSLNCGKVIYLVYNKNSNCSLSFCQSMYYINKWTDVVSVW